VWGRKHFSQRFQKHRKGRRGRERRHSSRNKTEQLFQALKAVEKKKAKSPLRDEEHRRALGRIDEEEKKGRTHGGRGAEDRGQDIVL